MIDPHLWAQLSWPDKNIDLAACPKREEWIDACIRRFRLSLEAPRIRFSALSGRAAYEIQCESANGSISLRFDQVAYQRVWGVEIFSENQKLDERIAAYCLNAALARLMSDWASVNHWCRDWVRNSDFLRTVSLTEDRLGNRFERLILGIINEEQEVATPATLYKDVQKWVDIRIAKIGAFKDLRIQVKFLRQIAQHDEEVGRHPRAKSTIIVSPVEIARFLEINFERGTLAYEWTEFLGIFPRKPCNLEDLASEIYFLFVALLGNPAKGPFDPVHNVPLVIRNAVRGLIRSRAAELAGNGSQQDH